MPYRFNEDSWNSFWSTGKIEHYLAYKGQISGFRSKKSGEGQELMPSDIIVNTLRQSAPSFPSPENLNS